ncbi:hypothetical protein P692DRAFT_20830555, partial [Suillus brevipes Sb2]
MLAKSCQYPGPCCSALVITCASTRRLGSGTPQWDKVNKHPFDSHRTKRSLLNWSQRLGHPYYVERHSRKFVSQPC